VGKCHGRTWQKLKERRKTSIYSSVSNPHSNQLPNDRMYTTDTLLIFTPDASTIFIIIFSILLIIAWIALLLWVRSVISRDSIQNEPKDVKLAVRGRSPPQSPLHPTPTTLPLSLSRPPPAYLSRSCPRSWGNLFINCSLRQRDDRIPSQPLQSPQYYVALFTGEIIRD
jgi:hypothetical protein